MNNISVAIPSFNTSEFIENAIKPLFNSKYVNEIVICDDCSKSDELRKLEDIIIELKKNTNTKIRLYKNKSNIGIFENKNKLIDLCSNDLIYVLDADNIPQNNLDKIIEKIFITKNKNYIYVPSKIYQFKKFHKIAKFLRFINNKYIVRFSKENKLIDKNTVIDFITNGTRYTIDKHLMWVLSVSNFFIYKSCYEEYVSKKYSNTKFNMSADFLGICFFYLENDGKIMLLKNFYHFHRKRKDSAALMSSKSFFESTEFFKAKFLE
tara:strand:+ start:398 stop:1192 length:795 start_codon:yes stop_codon:yes gene_type:complete